MVCHSDGGRRDLSDKQGDSAVFIYLAGSHAAPCLGKCRSPGLHRGGIYLRGRVDEGKKKDCWE